MMTTETKEYILKLCSQIGATPDDALYNLIGEESEKQNINKLFFSWYEHVMLEISNEMKEFVSDIKPTDILETLANYESNIRDYIGRITRLQNDIAANARAIEQRNREIDKLKREQGTDFSKALEEVLALKWYRLDEAKTLASTNPKAVYFVTPPVTCKGFDDLNGSMNEAALGQFHVKWCPSSGGISVHKYHDNATARSTEYYHPHVQPSGGICWGNGAAAFSQAIKERRPALALEALRVLLQTYNSESPYARLMDFRRGGNGINRARPEEIDYSKVTLYGVVKLELAYIEELCSQPNVRSGDINTNEVFMEGEGDYDCDYAECDVYEYESPTGHVSYFVKGTALETEYIRISQDASGFLDMRRS